MGGIGPMMGQSNHFRNYAPEKIQYGIDRYVNETKRLYGVADRRLAKSAYLAGDEYTIADIANFAWMRTWERQDVTIGEFPNVARWLDEIAARPAVQQGVEGLSDKRRAGPPQGKEWEIMFGAERAEEHTSELQSLKRTSYAG